MKIFTQSDFEDFFSIMGVRLIPRGNGRYQASCPMGHRHASGRDKHPSLSVVYGGITSGYRCFGCNEGGTIRTLAKNYSEHCGDSRPLEFIRSFDDRVASAEDIKKIGTYDQYQAKKIARLYKKTPQFKKPIGEEDLKHFMHEVHNYAFERGLTKSDVLKWEIGYDDYEDRLIVPVRDMHKKLIGVSGRAIDPEVKPKWKHYVGLNKELVWYGENFVDLKYETCFIVEGFFDVIHLSRFGVKNVFGSMGTSISEQQEQKLHMLMKNIIFIPDGEDVEKSNAGLKFAEDYGRKLLIRGSKFLRVGIAGVDMNPNYVKRDRPSKWEPEDFKYQIQMPLYSKDPADLTKDELKVVLSQTKWLTIF